MSNKQVALRQQAGLMGKLTIPTLRKLEKAVAVLNVHFRGFSG